MRQTSKIWIAAGILAAAAGGQAHADVVLSGPDSNDGTYSAAELSGLAAAGDTVTSDGVSGISLWGLLGGAGAASPTSPTYGDITTSTPTGDNGKNAILRYYLVGTSASGQQSVVSLGEIDPSFGGTAASPAFVAYKTQAGSLLSTPALVVPGAPGRDLSNLTSLQLLAVPALAAGVGGPSSSVALSGAVQDPGVYTKAKLATQFTAVTETVSGDTYTGVPLWTFLDPSDSDIPSQIVTTEGTDGYEVVLSLAELDPALGGNPQDLLPYADTGTDFPIDGVARTILPDDNKHGRWESNLAVVTVSPVPEPATLGLFAIGLATLGWMRRRLVPIRQTVSQRP